MKNFTLSSDETKDIVDTYMKSYCEKTDGVLKSILSEICMSTKDQISTLNRNHQLEITTLKEEHKIECQKLINGHEKEMDHQTSSLRNFSLVQSMSKEISEGLQNLKIAEDQNRSLKKQLAEFRPSHIQINSGGKLLSQNANIKADDHHVKINKCEVTEQPVVVTEQPVVVTKPEPQIEAAKPLVKVTKLHTKTIKLQKNVVESPKDMIEPPKEVIEPPKEVIEPPKEVIEPQKDVIESQKDVIEPPKVSVNVKKSFSKIKNKGLIYLLDKEIDENGEQSIYQSHDGFQGVLSGKKLVDGKYQWIK